MEVYVDSCIVDQQEHQSLYVSVVTTMFVQCGFDVFFESSHQLMDVFIVNFTKRTEISHQIGKSLRQCNYDVINGTMKASKRTIFVSTNCHPSIGATMLASK